jgi:hypothetical protein
VPAERKPSAWTEPVAARGSLSLRGRVLGAEGPVAGARVTATVAHGDDVLSDLSCKCDNECGRKLLECGCPEAAGQIVELVVLRTGEAQPVARATSGADGTYVLDGLDTQEVAVWADAPQGIGYLATAKAGQDNADVTLAKGRVIEGKVRSATGAPIAGAVVSAIYAERSRFFETLSGPTGEFKLGPVPEGRYAVVAMSEGMLPDHANYNPEFEKELALVLSPPRRLSGTVTREGRPVAGARVSLDGEHRKRKVETNGEGQFTFERLRPGKYDLDAKSAEGTGTALAIIAPDADRLGLTIELAAGFPLSGWVRDDRGAPVAGAIVGAQAGRGGAQKTTSLTDGAFSFTGLPPGKLRLEVKAKGFVARDSYDVTIEPPGKNGEVLVVRPAVVVSGTAADEKGAPIASYSVWLTSDRDAGEEGEEGSSRGNSDGGFSVEVVAGTYKLAANAQGFLPFQSRVTAPATGVQIVFRQGAHVSGRVTNTQGQPLEGWTVQAAPSQREQRDDLDFTDFLETEGSAQTDVQGRYEIKGLASGKFTVAASQGRSRGKKSGFSSAARASKTVELRGTERAEVDLQISQGLQVAGTVVDARGNPVVGAMVAGSTEKRDDRRYVVTETDAQGKFSIWGFEPGRVGLNAMTRQSSESAAAWVNAGDTNVRLTFSEQRMVAGRVVGEGGRPVVAFDLNGKLFDAVDGRFEVPAAGREGKMRLVVTASGYAQFGETFETKEGRTDVGDIRLSRGRALSGIVTDAETGKPIVGALVDVGDDDDQAIAGNFYLSEKNGAVRTDSAGRYRLTVDDRVSRAFATAEGRIPASQPMGNETIQLNFALSRGATLSVSLLDKNGNAVTGLAFAIGPGERMVRPRDFKGPIRLDTLTPGKWKVMAQARGVRFRPATVDVGTRLELELTMREVTGGATVTAQVPGEQPGEISISLVTGKAELPKDMKAWQSLMTGAEIFTDPRGVFENVLPGEYTAIVYRRRERSTEGFAQTVRISEQSAQTIVLAPPTGWQATQLGE